MGKNRANDVKQKTSKLFAILFSFTGNNDFNNFRKYISTKHFKEPPTFFKNKRVLDLGCGGLGATISGFIKEGAKEVVGIDLSKENNQRLKKRFYQNKKVKLIVGNICKLPKNIGTFDIVFSGGVIHHVDNPQKAIQEAYHVLKPGGTIIVYLYGKGGIINAYFRIFRVVKYFLPFNFFLRITKYLPKQFTFFLGDYIYVPIQHHYTEKQAKKMFYSAGFKKVLRLPNTRYISNILKYLLPSQLDYQSIWSKIMFGAGGITLKGKKPNL